MKLQVVTREVNVAAREVTPGDMWGHVVTREVSQEVALEVTEEEVT